MSISVVFTSNLGEFKEALPDQMEASLEEIGLVAEGFAKRLCPVRTGNLRNSITHDYDMSESAVYIGTNVEYGKYIELGTGAYASEGGGRTTPWSYMDEEGKWHRTIGNRPQPYLRPAVENNKEVYKSIVQKHLQG